MVSAMGDADGKGRGGFVLLDQNFKARSPGHARIPGQLVPNKAHLPACRGSGAAADMQHTYDVTV